MYAKLFRPHQYFSNSISIIISILLSSLIIPGHNAKYDSRMYEACKEKTTSACGKSVEGGIEFPFWGGDFRSLDCGLKEFELSCDESGLAVNIGSSYKFHVVEINPSEKALQLNHIHPLDSFCGSSSIRIPDTTLNEKLYSYSQRTEYLRLFYHCSEDIKSPPFNPDFTCGNEDEDKVYFFPDNELLPALKDEFSSCYNTTLLVDKMVLQEYTRDRKTLQPQALFDRSFEVMYNVPNQEVCTDCINAHGLCWFGTYFGSNDPCLYQQSGLPPSLPPSLASGKRDNSNLIVGIATGLGGGFILILLAVFFFFYRRKKTKQGSYAVSRNVSSYPKDVDAFIEQYGSSIPRRFRYSTIKKITNSFKDELGNGGYGIVYRGSLSDGRDVAVKVLHATKGNGEEFINEVASIGRTSHVNVVTLLGFCYEGKRRALVYEFMPNGSLEKFIYGTSPLLEGHLGWDKLFNIAIGIARGLEYLHRGCNTRILHFDIKPHNILLDKDFHPKISDFGLAKLYTKNESAVSSLLQARGTIGYIAPEVTSRNFGQVSHKSDVYSYGMMILEMAGGRKNVNARADHTSEIYYPRWLYKRVQNDDVLNLANEISEKENELVRKMVIVGLWCIQMNPSQRPSISKVIEMLEGKTAALEIPPKPYMCSAPSSPSNSQSKLVLCPASGIETTSST